MAGQYVLNGDQRTLEKYMQEIPERLRHIYQDTRGILNYQEQIMALCQEMAGYSLGGADILRRAIGKKFKPLIQMVRFEFIYGTDAAIPMAEKFLADMQSAGSLTSKEIAELIKELKSLKSKTNKVPGAIHMGFTEEYSLHTYNAIERFSGYSFNRPHSAAYAKLAYQTAYLKTHYPVEFVCAQLTVEADDADNKKERKIVRNVAEARRLNIPILPPDINKSELGFNIEMIDELDDQGNPTGHKQKAIRVGLLSILGIGEKAVEEILKRSPREDEPESEGTPYKDFDDFFHRVNKRVVNKGPLAILIKAGCFDYDVPNRLQLLNHFAFNLRGDKEFLGTRSKFEKEKAEGNIKAEVSFRENPADFNEDLICEWELEFFELYLSHHPYQELPYSNWDDVRNNQTVEMGGKITKVKMTKTKAKQEDMCFLTVDTAGGKIDVTVFPRTYEEWKPELFKGNIAIFAGRKDSKDDKPQLLLDKVKQVRKKKFKVEKPPELAELAARNKGKKKGQMTLDDFGGVTVKKDPLAFLFGEEAEAEPPAPSEPKEDGVIDLAKLFE